MSFKVTVADLSISVRLAKPGDEGVHSVTRSTVD